MAKTRGMMDEIVTALHAEPFERFEVHLVDNRSYIVDHPDFLSRSPDNSMISIWTDESVSVRIPIEHVTSVTSPIIGSGRRKKKRAG
ncbi:MAG: hypothetical protein AAGD32_02765 [Planctomycetota bacterium]